MDLFIFTFFTCKGLIWSINRTFGDPVSISIPRNAFNFCSLSEPPSFIRSLCKSVRKGLRSAAWTRRFPGKAYYYPAWVPLPRSLSSSVRTFLHWVWEWVSELRRFHSAQSVAHRDTETRLPACTQSPRSQDALSWSNPGHAAVNCVRSCAQ